MRARLFLFWWSRFLLAAAGAPGSGVGNLGLGVAIFYLVHRVHREQRFLPVVKSPAAPRPISRMTHKPALHRIGMHVVQLLHSFSRAIHVEVVKTRLPEWLRRLFAFFERQRNLVRKQATAPFAQALRNPQLQSMKDNRRSHAGRFIEQQMHVLGHHHVSDDAKAKFRAQAAEFLQENFS